MRQYVFLDECGVTTDLVWRYGRSPRGTRLRDHTLDTRSVRHRRTSDISRDGRFGTGFAIKSARLHAAANPFAVNVIDVPSNRVRIARICG